MASARFPTPINNCAASPVRGSDRWVIQTPGSAPVIAIQTLSDFYPLDGFYSRRADATGADGNYRLYEIAGAGHIWSTQVAYTPSGDEPVRAGFPANWWDRTATASRRRSRPSTRSTERWRTRFAGCVTGSRADGRADPGDGSDEPSAQPLTDAYGECERRRSTSRARRTSATRGVAAARARCFGDPRSRSRSRRSTRSTRSTATMFTPSPRQPPPRSEDG